MIKNILLLARLFFRLKPGNFYVTAGLFGAALCVNPTTADASESIIYQHSFGGSASESLLGQAPDIRPSNEVFVSNDSTSQTDLIKADGTVTGDGRPSLYLPFRVVAGRKNIVGLDVQLDPGNPAGEHWYGLCLARGATLPSQDGGLANSLSAMFLLRENGDAQFLSWGTQVGNASRALNATSGRLEIVLDNTSPNADLWVIEFRLNGNLVFSTQYLGGNFNPDSSDPISWVGFGKWGPTQGRIDNFTVKVSPALAHAATPVDPSTVQGKVICGYQGWFTAPIEGDSRWIHWGKAGFDDDGNPIDHAKPDGTNLRVDMYPDLREFDADELYPTAMPIGTGGDLAPLYSGSNPKTVRRHVRWMQEYGIDGVFVQRFLADHTSGDVSYAQQLNKTLWSIKNGCQEYGRVFAVMYDISGKADNDAWVEELKNDWMSLVDRGLTTGGRYLQEGGKPLVGIWGMGFTDRPPSNPAVAQALINWFQNDAPPKYRASVFGGVPAQWRTLNGDSRNAAAWGDVYRSYDVISPWTVGRYNNNAQADNWKTTRVVPDITAAQAAGRAYGTVVWPGFSWKNLTGGTLNQIPRNGGSFYWRQIFNAVDASTSMIYVAMFDEVDEATAIYKVAENAAQAPTVGQWVNLDADGTALPSDWYLRLTYEAGRMLRDPSLRTPTLPSAPGPQTVTGPALSNTWDGGGGFSDEWSNPENWVGDVLPDFNLPLTFAGSYAGAAAPSAYQFDEPPPTIQGLKFAPSAGAFTLLGSPVVLAGDVANQSTRTQSLNLGIILSGTTTFAATDGNLTVGGALSGTGALRKTGDQTMTLSGLARHTGGTEVVAGTLTFVNVPPSGQGFLAGNLTIRPGGTVYLNEAWSLGYTGNSANSVNSITIEGGSLVLGANHLGGSAAQTITMTGGSIRQLGDRDLDLFHGDNNVSANPVLRTLALSNSAVIDANLDLRLGVGNSLTLDVAAGSVSGGPDLLIRGGLQDGAETGGIVKSGAGKVIFAGANTYTGDTRVNAGTLELAATGTQQFKILGDGTNNAIRGPGRVVLSGALAFDLSAAGNGYPNSWQVVTAEGPRTYGPGFQVLGFSPQGDGTWRRSLNDRVYEFSQATGQLRTTEFGGSDRFYTSLRGEMTSAGYPVSNNDLLQTSVVAIDATGNFTLEGCGGLEKLTDGQFGTPGTETAPSATCQQGDVITYTLDTSANVRGYDLTKTVSTTSWNENRIGQRYDVEIRKVGAPAGVFVPLVSVDYRPGSSGTSSAQVTVTAFSGSGGLNTGTLASGVEQIRFIFKNGTIFGHSMYRELDVFGTPTGLGGLDLISGGGFESPPLGDGFAEGSPAAGWNTLKRDDNPIFGGGRVGNGSMYGNPAAPEGGQAALLKGPGGLEQVVSGFEVGKTYTLSFKAAGRFNIGLANPFQVSLDGQVLSFAGSTTLEPPDSYKTYTGQFTARHRTMTLAFVSTLPDSTLDYSTYLDDVRIQEASLPSSPTFTSAGGLLTGTVGQPFSYAAAVIPDPAIFTTTYQISGILPAGLSLNAGTGIISGTPTQAENRTVTLTATNVGGTSSPLALDIQISASAASPYDQWLNQYPGLTDTAGTADPDGDGWTNLQEFFFGGNPTAGDGAFFAASRAGSQIRFTFVARRTGATYAISSSATLAAGSWESDTEAQASLTDAADQSGISNPVDYVRRQFTVTPAAKKFYRVGGTFAP